jgi:hypothetical protein
MSEEESFANFEFKVDCPNIILTRRGNSPLAITGPGELWQDKNGQLQFKLFALENNCWRLMKLLDSPHQLGKLIPDDDFFHLQAITNSEKSWWATRILPSFSGGRKHGIIHGALREIESNPSLPFSAKDGISFSLKGLVDFPCNTRTSSHTQLDSVVTRFASRGRCNGFGRQPNRRKYVWHSEWQCRASL